MFHRIVLTAGTSAFAPSNMGDWAKAQEVFEWPKRDPVAPGGDEEAAFAAWQKALGGLAAEDLRRCSAEISMLNALRTMKRLGPSPEVVLIFTETIAGRAAAMLVERLARTHFAARVSLRPVGGFDTDSPPALKAALGSFMNEVARALEGCDRWSTCFAPLGGYKVMTSLGYLAGAYLGFSTAYLHEDRQVLHMVPAVPIRVDPGELTEVAPLFRRAQGLVPLSSLSQADRALLDRFAYLFDVDQAEDLLGPSTFGMFLRQRPDLRAVLGTAVLVSAQVAGAFQGDERWIAAQIEVLNTLRAKGHKGAQLHHELDFGHHGAAFHLYKGVSNGRRAFRAAWRYEPAHDRLEINRLWLDHDRYEREAKTGAGLFEAESSYPTGWADITDRLSVGK